jgi:hypothetical protein
MARRLVERVVERRRAERSDRLHSLADGLAVGRECDDAPVAAVETGHGHLVFGGERVEEPRGRPPGVGDLLLLRHGPARVHEQQDARRESPRPVEMDDRLHPPLLEDAELVPPEVDDRSALAVHRDGGEDDEVAPCRKGEHLPGGRAREGAERHDESGLLQRASGCSQKDSIAAPGGGVVTGLTYRRTGGSG